MRKTAQHIHNPKGNEMTDVTAGSQITFMPGVDNGVKNTLKELFKNTSATELAAKKPHEIVPQIAGVLPDENPLEIAGKLLKFLNDMGFSTVPASTSKTTSEPQRVIVEMPKALDEHTICELLGMLNENQGDTTEVLSALTAKPEVNTALNRADGKIVVPTEDGKIDTQATSDYIKKLNLRFSEPRRKVNGKFPITLERALGLTRLVTLNPITLKINYVGVEDEFDVVISNLSDERYFALLWALLTNHPRMPRTTDEDELETYLEQIFADDGSLKRRWKVIFEDYAQACQDGDAMTQGLIRQMTEDQAKQLLGRVNGSQPSNTFGRTQAQSAIDYEAKVRERAGLVAPTKRVTGNSARESGGVCEHLYVGGNSCTVTGLVVLDGGSVTGNSCQVNVYAPPRVSLSDGGNSNRISVTNVTWKELAERLGLA